MSFLVVKWLPTGIPREWTINHVSVTTSTTFSTTRSAPSLLLRRSSFFSSFFFSSLLSPPPPFAHTSHNIKLLRKEAISNFLALAKDQITDNRELCGFFEVAKRIVADPAAIESLTVTWWSPHRRLARFWVTLSKKCHHHVVENNTTLTITNWDQFRHVYWWRMVLRLLRREEEQELTPGGHAWVMMTLTGSRLLNPSKNV